jgi:hypothetical protein
MASFNLQAGGTGRPSASVETSAEPAPQDGSGSNWRADVRWATWNVRTMRAVGELERVAEIARRADVEVLAVQETRRQGEEKEEVGEYVFYGCGKTDGKAERGVGVFVRKSVDVNAVVAVNERIMRMSIRGFRVIVIYSSTEMATEADKDEFWNAWGCCCEADVDMILGNFNARVGEEYAGESSVGVGRFGLERDTNDNGNRMLSLMRRKSLKLEDVAPNCNVFGSCYDPLM